MKKSTYNTYEWICTAVNILQLAFNTILSLTEIFRVISVSKSSTVGLKLRYANNLVIPQYQVDNTVPSMKYQNRSALTDSLFHWLQFGTKHVRIRSTLEEK